MNEHFVDIGITLHVYEWSGDRQPFVLLHGLASNSHTWHLVAERLAARGHRVIAFDQRGHGRSDKPESGYDFGTITADLAKLLDALQIEQPVLAGQSWGGNVVLSFGVTYPDAARGLVFVDGGFFDMQMGDPSWEKAATRFQPSPLEGRPRAHLKLYLSENHPDWGDAGIEATLASFETLPDGTLRPWLSHNRHLRILRAMWEQRPRDLYHRVQVPVLIAVAQNSRQAMWTTQKAQQVGVAQTSLRDVTVQWFAETDHEIHLQRPDALVTSMLDWLDRLHAPIQE